jgi:hypothetical protein
VIGGHAHDPDDPDPAGERGGADRELDGVSLPQPGAQPGLVDALGQADGERRPQLLAVGREALHAKHRQRVAQRGVCATVALPAGREPLVADGEAQRLVQRDDELHGRDVVQRAAAAAVGPLGEEADEVEVPGLPGTDPPLELAQRAVAGRERGQARRRAEARVTDGEGDVDELLVEPQRLAAQGGRTVDEQQRVVLAAGVAEAIERLRNARGGLAVHDGDGVAAGAHRGHDPLGRQRAPELAVDAYDVRARAREGSGEALADQAGDAAHDAVARIDEVRDGGLHAGAAGAGDRQCRARGGCERVAQKHLRLVHHGREGWVHRPRGGTRQACAHAVGQRTRAGPEQQRLEAGFAQGASTSGKCSARWVRRVSRTKRRSSCDATR